MSLAPQKNQSLKEFNWWKVGGTAEYYLAPKSIDQVIEAVKWADQNQLPLRVLSGGSNVLIQEGVVRGLTLHLTELTGVDEVCESGEFVTMTCMAGTPKSDVAKVFLQKRLAPAVFLTGIPGDMGGGVVMNAGVGEARRPREFCEIVDWVEVVRLDEVTHQVEILRTDTKDIEWHYRGSRGWQPGVIVRLGVKWENRPSQDVMNEVRAATKKRVSTQPLNLPSCGSVFRNPEGHKAAQLIESCGLKGHRCGGVAVSDKHANFIVNDKGGTSNDILALISHVRNTVESKYGVKMIPEVQLFGDFTQDCFN